MSSMTQAKLDKLLTLAKSQGYDEGFKQGYDRPKPQDFEPPPPPQVQLKAAEEAVELNSMKIKFGALADEFDLRRRILNKFPEAVTLFAGDDQLY